MAPTNRVGKKSKASPKWTKRAEEDNMEFENSDLEDRDMDLAEKKPEGEVDAFNLKEVLRLGGTKADFVFLTNLNETEILVDGGQKDAIDDLEEGELEKFIEKLGLRQFAHVQIVPEEREEEPEEKEEKEEEEKEQEKEENELPEKQPARAKAEKPDWKKALAEEKKKKKKEKKAAAWAKQDIFEFRPRRGLLVKPGGKWYRSEYSGEGSERPQDPQLTSSYRTLARQLYEADVALFKSQKKLQKGANSAWVKTVVSTGVLADRMAAVTLLVQDAPLHTLEHVEALVAMVGKKGGRRAGLMALDTLRELLLSELLPEERKLRFFDQRPLDRLEEMASGNREVRDRRLFLWYFEHLLKHQVARLAASLDEASHDTVAATKAKALDTAFRLLCERPEQERAFLAQVVNKLGDPEYKTAAKASHLMETLLFHHPNMKTVVCCEVERLLFRANVGARAQYYAVCFLNQVRLSHEEKELAARLVSVYFAFFQACVAERDLRSKMLGALLTGVNRAYPYAGENDRAVEEQTDTLFRVAHLAKFNAAVQALMLLFQVMNSRQSLSDRFYVALYRKILDGGLSASDRHNMFLNLLYKSLKTDTSLRRVRAFLKRLMQVGAQQGASFACAVLFLYSELTRAKPALRAALHRSATDAEEMFRDIPEDEEEIFRDADEAEEGQEQVEGQGEEEESKSKSEELPSASWVHRHNLKGSQKRQTYDPLHRNPLFCAAERDCVWELHGLSRHFHPTVSLYAKTLLQGDSIKYSGDPLQDFTLMRFLDRFVFRNPKKSQGKQNTDATVMKPQRKPPGVFLAVNSPEFLAKEESQIAADQIFFYRFFKKQQEQAGLTQPQADNKHTERVDDDVDDDVDEEVDDEEFETILDSYEGDYADFLDVDLDFAGNVTSKKGRKKGADDSDDESDPDDLDDEEMSLGSMDAEEFGEDDVDDDVDEEGGTFVDELEEADEDQDDLDSDEDHVPEAKPPSKKAKRKSKEEPTLGSRAGKKKRWGDGDDHGDDHGDVFAAAEEFGCLLDDNADSKVDSVGPDAMSNADKAGLKQLKWERQRHDWIHNRDAKSMRRKKAAFNKKKRLRRGPKRK
ncbi:CCAAT/enhancer-binding protein zeta isoform X2 [Stigmatopora nigra]